MSIEEVAPAPTKSNGRRHRGWRIAGTIVGSLFAVIVATLVGYSIATTPSALPGRAPLYAFNPEVVGRVEQQAWAYYYYHQWPQLFDSMLRMTRSAFGLSLPRAMYASY